MRDFKQKLNRLIRHKTYELIRVSFFQSTWLKLIPVSVNKLCCWDVWLVSNLHCIPGVQLTRNLEEANLYFRVSNILENWDNSTFEV